MIVHAFVIYCLSLNPYVCRNYEIMPVGHRITSIGECMRGGMMGSAEFQFEGARWYIKGVRCTEESDPVQEYLTRK